MMSRSLRVVMMALITAVLAGCGGGASTTPESAPDASEGESAASEAAPSEALDTTSVTIAWNSPPDELYLPLLMAIAAMQEQGYNIEGRQLPETNLVIQAMTADQVQFGAEGLPTGATAIEEGAPIRVISTQNSNQVVWTTIPEFADCNDMEGAVVGIFSFDSGFKALVDVYLDQNCPGVRDTFEYVIIQDSALRAQAIAEGQIQATALGLPDALALQRDYPDQFNYIYLAEELEGIGDEHVYTNLETYENHPTIVSAFVREQLLATRALYEDPSRATEYLAVHLPDVESDAVVQEFIRQRIWPANGGLRGPGLENTLEGLNLPGDPENMVVPDILEGVLEEIGVSDFTEH